MSSRATNSIQSFIKSIDPEVDLTMKTIQRKDIIKSTKSKYATKYSKEEKRVLFGAVMKHSGSWKLISEKYFSSKRSPLSLSIKWVQINQDNKLPLSFYFKNKNHYIKEWTKKEDKILIEKINKYGVGSWARISTYLPKKVQPKLVIDIKNYHSYQKKENGQKMMIDPYLICKENIKLNNAIIEHGENWYEILKLFPHRELNDIKAHDRSNPRLNPFVNVGKWNTSEIKKFGRDWENVSKLIKTRSPMQCYTYQYVRKKKE
ncbi:hypothetical protein RclHR1_00020066 [Rhizophagus clarus]|uniref:Uncharacterized protein n=1 Tax=Rhizophagus clarus TaxID=94130 RepID=A0A2Z6QPN9_9GLOM|nr:hypothetical protein RclHR1_00020066 [Rhizophagus clarus]